MRILLLGTATIALSGCSWLGLGGSNHYGYAPQQTANHGYYTGAHHTGALSKWNLEGAVGQEYMVKGDFTTPDDVAAVPGLTPNGVKMKDAYDAGMRYELGGSYALNPNRKVTLMANYSKAEGKDVAFGTLAGPPVNTLRGTASDYESYGVEAGLRQYFRFQRAPIVGSIRPYVEAKAGASKVKDITISNLRDNGGAVNGGTAAFYDGKWVPTGAGIIGIEAPVFKRATLALETGIRYRGELDSNTTDFGAGGGVSLLTGLNNGSENWSVPVTLRGRYRF